MSHGDAVQAAPEGFQVLATSEGSPVAAFEDPERRLYGMQWHPEVKHSVLGQEALERFLYDGARLEPTWTPGNVIAEQVEAIRAQVGNDRVICGLSGGVDSSVAAALVQRAVGDQLTCVFVDHGLLRAGEAEQVEKDFVAATGVNAQGRRRLADLPRGPRRASPTPRPSARSSAASSSAPSRRPPARSSPRPATAPAR